MKLLAILSAAILGLMLAGPSRAEHVIEDPGWCAQFYPNANCQNYGRGNPYTSYGWARAYRGHHHYWHRRHWH